jgi:hypothetical protein
MVEAEPQALYRNDVQAPSLPTHMDSDQHPHKQQLGTPLPAEPWWVPAHIARYAPVLGAL